MTELKTRRWLPWGGVLTLAALAAILVAVYRGSAVAGSPMPSWASTWAAVGAGMAAFLVMRWLQNYLWAIVAGLCVPLHPLYLERRQPFDQTLIAETLVLCGLAGTVAAWRLAFLPRFAWRSWLAGGMMLCVVVTLAWPLQPRIGLVTSTLVAIGLLGAALLATLFRLRKASVPPCWLNIAVAVFLGIAVPIGGVLLGPVSVQHCGWRQDAALPANSDGLDFVEAALPGQIDAYKLHGFSALDLRRWAWPEIWLVLPLMVWGLWRSFRRGWKNWARRQPPLAWVLTLFAVIDLAGASLYPGQGTDISLLSFASLAVLLGLFGIADVVRGFMERLVLAPPHERDE